MILIVNSEVRILPLLTKIRRNLFRQIKRSRIRVKATYAAQWMRSEPA